MYVSYRVDEYHYKNLKSYLVIQLGEKYGIKLSFKTECL